MGYRTLTDKLGQANQLHQRAMKLLDAGNVLNREYTARSKADGWADVAKVGEALGSTISGVLGKYWEIVEKFPDKPLVDYATALRKAADEATSSRDLSKFKLPDNAAAIEKIKSDRYQPDKADDFGRLGIIVTKGQELMDKKLKDAQAEQARAVRSRGEVAVMAKKLADELDKLNFMGIKELEEYRKSIRGLASGDSKLMRPLPVGPIPAAALKYKQAIMREFDQYLDKIAASHPKEIKVGMAFKEVNTKDLLFVVKGPTPSRDPKLRGTNAMEFQLRRQTKWDVGEHFNDETMSESELRGSRIKYLRT